MLSIPKRDSLIAGGEHSAYYIAHDGSLKALGTEFPSFSIAETGALRQIASGNEHLLLLTQDRNVYSLGRGSEGQLGRGKSRPCTVPTLVPLSVPIVKIDAGTHSSVALDVNGRLWVWGQNQFGQLGLGHKNNVMEPTIVPGLRVRDFACGSFHMLVVDVHDDLYGCGSNLHQPLALPDIVECTTPLLLPWSGGKIAVVQAGDYCSFLLTEDGRVYRAGRRFGRRFDEPRAIEFEQVQGVADVVQLVCVRRTAAFLNKENTLYMCGDSTYQTIKNGRDTVHSVRDDVVAVFATYYRHFIITKNHEILASGRNIHGELGVAPNSPEEWNKLDIRLLTPEPMDSPSNRQKRLENVLFDWKDPPVEPVVDEDEHNGAVTRCRDRLNQLKEEVERITSELQGLQIAQRDRLATERRSQRRNELGSIEDWSADDMRVVWKYLNVAHHTELDGVTGSQAVSMSAVDFKKRGLSREEIEPTMQLVLSLWR